MDMRLRVAEMDLQLLIHGDNLSLSDETGIERRESYLDNKFWRTETKGKEITVDIYPVMYLPPVGGLVIWESDTCTVKKSGDVEIRVYHDGIIKQPYAIYSESRKKDIKVWCETNWLKRHYNTNYLFNICAVEKRLMHNNKVVFHCCYIKIKDKAVLFSGFSGAGKSTQGALWEKYEDAFVINGDRAVLGKRGEQWYAYGFPFSGTSGICHNITSPVAGIVFLNQAENNMIYRVDPADAWKLLWPQFTVNQWDTEFVDAVLALTDKIAAEVPIYELYCTPDERAVICVKEKLGL